LFCSYAYSFQNSGHIVFGAGGSYDRAGSIAEYAIVGGVLQTKNISVYNLNDLQNVFVNDTLTQLKDSYLGEWVKQNKSCIMTLKLSCTFKLRITFQKVVFAFFCNKNCRKLTFSKTVGMFNLYFQVFACMLLVSWRVNHASEL